MEKTIQKSNFDEQGYFLCRGMHKTQSKGDAEHDTKETLEAELEKPMRKREDQNG